MNGRVVLVLVALFSVVAATGAMAAVMVPDVEGENEEVAVGIIQGLDLIAGIHVEYSCEVDPKVVISQSPASGSMVDENSTVQLLVSQGCVTPEAYNYQGLIYCLMGLFGVWAFCSGFSLGTGGRI